MLFTTMALTLLSSPLWLAAGLLHDGARCSSADIRAVGESRLDAGDRDNLRTVADDFESEDPFYQRLSMVIMLEDDLLSLLADPSRELVTPVCLGLSKPG